MSEIDRAGVYDIEIERYHHDANLCDAPSISSSGLRTILLECPAKYWAFSPYNPNHFHDESTKALDIGKAAHCLTLGEPEFAKHFIVSPYDLFTTKVAREWRDAALDMGLTVLKAKDFELVQTLSAIQKRSGQAMQAFQDGQPEKSLLWRDPETGIWLRARPDWLPNAPDARLTTEFKTAISIEPNKWARDAFAFGYHLQAAMILDGIAATMGVEPLGCAFVIQEKAAPYLCEVRLFQPDQIEWGRKQYKRALKTSGHFRK